MNFRKLMLILGYSEGVAAFIILFYFFLNTYLNDYKTTLDINHFGEAHIEWFMLCLMSNFVLIGLWYLLKDLKDII